MFEYLFYRLGELIALSLTQKAAYKLAVFLSSIHYLFAFRDRRIITDNLKVIFPEKSDKELSSIRKRVFHNFAKYLTDFLRFRNLNSEYIKKNVKLVNIGYINEGLKNNNGAILVTAHLGNWELGGVAISMLGFPISTVALPHKSRIVNNFFDNQRKSKGVKVFPLGKAAKSCFKELKHNKVIALVGDRDFVGSGREIEFFGKPTIFPEGPAFFALKTNAVIIPGFMLRESDDSFSLIMSKPLDYLPTGDYSKDLDSIIMSYKKVFENYIREYPDQWYMFRRFWK